ncbi:MAG: ABC-type branched-subunit amino acid transport system ATPase component [Glaciecola sp.]
MAFEIFGFEITAPTVILGLIMGMTYGVLAVGLVLVYRSNRIINLAHGEMGAFGASLFLLMTTNDAIAIPYYVALPLALLGAAGISAGSEVVVIRRLRKAPKIMSIVATLGLGQFLVLMALIINPDAGAGNLYPSPPGLPIATVGPLRITQAYWGMLIFIPLIVIGIAIFLRRSIYGLAIRGAAANSESARLSAISSSRMSSLSWAIAGGLSALSAILYAPTTGFLGATAFGPTLLLRALVAAVVARFTSLPIALATGLGIGVLEQTMLWNVPRGGLIEAVLFVLILVGLLLQRDVSGRSGDQGAWSSVQALKPLPELLDRLPSVVNLRRALPIVGLVFLLAIPSLTSNATAATMVGIFSFVVVGLSVGIVTGLNGQLSLGQFAIAGVGAAVSYQVAFHSGNYVLAVLYAGLAGAAASLVIGVPALRIKGLMLAVTTLGFALVTQYWLVGQDWMLGTGVDPGRPIVLGKPLTTGTSYYFYALALSVMAWWLARNLWKSGFGRQLISVRDNEDNARAFTIPATAVKLRAFLIAGFIAGVGGSIYAHSLARISSSTFPVAASVTVAVMTVIGGVGVLSGPVLGAILLIAIPAFVPLDAAGLATSSFGQLLILMYLPGGLAGLLEPVRNHIVDMLARRAGIDPVQVRAEAESPVSAPDADRVASLEVVTRPAREANASLVAGSVLLEATDLSKHFGGVRAVDGVSLRIRAGQVVGLIGPNGAGKTTTFELLAGFTPPDQGRVLFNGADVTRERPEERAKRGMIRSFQGAPLFPTLTVLETVRLSLERESPTKLTHSLLGITSGERHRDQRARELINFLGLDVYRNKVIGQLSTGTRRITEIACLVALQPKLLLLDEPASGVAQSEIEAMTTLLLKLKDLMNTTFLIIEHDIPMIMAVSDRVIAMDTGRIIAAGDPQSVRDNDHVVSAYLGGNAAAIERSAHEAAVPTGAAS